MFPLGGFPTFAVGLTVAYNDVDIFLHPE